MKLFTALFATGLATIGFAQGETYQVPTDYCFAVHFSGNTNDEKGQQQVESSTYTIGTGLFGVANSGLEINSNQQISYNSVNSRPTTGMSMIVAAKIDKAAFDAMKSGNYVTIFQNGRHYIRILKNTSQAIIQFGIRNTNPASSGQYEVTIPLDLTSTSWLNILENRTVYQLVYSQTGGSLRCDVGGIASANNSVGNFPLGWPIDQAEDTLVSLGIANFAPVQDFKGNIDYAYIYPRAITYAESKQFGFNMNENLSVNGTNTISINQFLPNSGVSIQWFSVDANGNRSDISGAIAATFTPTSNGTYGAKIAFGPFVTISEYVKIGTGSSVSVIENNSIEFSIFPNPAIDQLSIEHASGAAITLYDISGKLMMKTDNYQNETLQIGHLSNGIYFVRIEKDGQIGTAKFVKE